MAKQMREVFGEMLVGLGQENRDVFVLDADLCTSTMAHLFRDAFPRRFLQCGIAEQNMFGVAAGLAAAGAIPFPVTFAVFATKRACDQVSISIAYPKLNVKIPGSYPGLPTGKAGATHQSVEDLAIMRAMPHMMVVDPGDNEELRQVMSASIEYSGPVYFRVTRASTADIPWPKGYRFQWGKAITLREGSDVTLIGTGFMTGLCLLAADALVEKGVSARVDHHPCLKPLDRQAVEEAARVTGAIVTVENHSVLGGLGGAVAEVQTELCPVPQRRVGIRDRFVETGEIPELFDRYRMRVVDIIRAAEDVLRVKNERQ